MRRGIMLAIFCELCLVLSLSSASALADSTKNFDENIGKLSSHDADSLSGYAPWKDIARSLKDSDFDGVLAIHWASGYTTFSNGFKHAIGKRRQGASGDDENTLLLSEIITLVPHTTVVRNKRCSRRSGFRLTRPLPALAKGFLIRRLTTRFQRMRRSRLQNQDRFSCLLWVFWV